MSGYGINCEEETAYAFEMAGAVAEIVHINDLILKNKKMEDYHIMVFPGGFSYGDDTGSGNAFANKIKNNLWADLMGFIDEGKLILGICNGFQILTNLGLFALPESRPGERNCALLPNIQNRYECRWVNIKNNSPKCVFTKGIDISYLPIAHGEGRFYCDEETLKKLKDNEQIVFTYCNNSGEPANGQFPINPNGAIFDVAGICDKSGRIMGMMPHPERALYTISQPNYHEQKVEAKKSGINLPDVIESNFKIFQNAVDFFKLNKNLKGDIGINEYGISGVNVDVEEIAAKILYEAAKKTFENRTGNIGEIVVPFDDFSGIRAVNVSNLPGDSFMCLTFDGIGTKVEIAQRMNNHRTIAFDLFAMVCDDAIVRGGEPVLIGSVLDVNTLGNDTSKIKIIEQLAEGYVKAAEAANVAVINGELAQLGKAVGGYGDFSYNWCSGLVWFGRKPKLFTGKEIQVGDYIVALQEKGFRSNGFSLVRKTFEGVFGEKWHEVEFEGRKLGEHVLMPSTIYSKAIIHMHGGFKTDGCCEIHGIAHITGGGLPSKVGRALKFSGYGAKLDNLFEPCSAMLYCQKVGNIPDSDAYRTWCMGNGLIVITPEPERVIEEARKFGIEGKIAGRIIPERKIIIKSFGIQKRGEELTFDMD